MTEIESDFVVGRAYQDNTGWRQPGDLLRFKDVEGYPYLESLIAAGLLYRYAPEKGYDWLPPHLFSYTATLQERRAQLAAMDASLEVPWDKPDQLSESEKLDEAERESHARNNAAAQVRAERFHQRKNVPETGAVKVKENKPRTDGKKEDAARAGYEAMTRDELEREVRSRMLSTLGNKHALVERLVEDDASS